MTSHTSTDTPPSINTDPADGDDEYVERLAGDPSNPLVPELDLRYLHVTRIDDPALLVRIDGGEANLGKVAYEATFIGLTAEGAVARFSARMVWVPDSGPDLVPDIAGTLEHLAGKSTPWAEVPDWIAAEWVGEPLDPTDQIIVTPIS